MFTLRLDVDQLPKLNCRPFLFAYDRWAICSVKSGDYLTGGGDLRQKVEQALIARGIANSPARILLVTMPRICGYVFNPVSFFVCFNEQGLITACITQVNNTFGETHIYPLVTEPKGLPIAWSFAKEFFVSPFFDTKGEYFVALNQIDSGLDIEVDLWKEGEKAFGSSLRGDPVPFSRANLLKTLIIFSWNVLLTMPRIHLQALVLFFGRGAVPHQKPKPSSSDTVRYRQNVIHRIRLGFLSILSLVSGRSGAKNGSGIES
jgi:cyclopropane-fatty-acyl-phospholipid synthase